VALFLGVSVRTVQRMQASGLLVPCPGYGREVLYPAERVLELAGSRGAVPKASQTRNRRSGRVA
jgi:hypothetical protein